MERQLTSAIVAPSTGEYSETFIRDHIAFLPGIVVPVYGGGAYAQFAGRPISPTPIRLLASNLATRLPKSIRQLGNRSVDRALARFWRSHAVEVVMAEYATTATWLVRSCELARVPLVVHCHGYDVYRQETLERYQSEYKDVFRSASAFIVGSHDMEQHVKALGVAAGRVHYNPCGVDLKQFPAGSPETNPPTVVAVGRFVDKKAPQLTILAFARAHQECPEAKLVMAGEGPLLNMCKQLVRALHLSERVQFLGRQTPEQIAALLRGARLFAQHSVVAPDGDSEGTAISVLEAAATGLPIVATAHAGIKDTVLDNVTGLLSPEYDIDAMSLNLATLLSQPALAATMGQHGRARVTEHFSMERSINGIYNILLKAARS